MTRLLLDSHTLIWAADDPKQIPPVTRALIADFNNERLISTATIWEISIKASRGRLPLSLPCRPWMEKAIADLCANVLPITIRHADGQIRLPFHHRDPFDRLLAAQSLAENLTLVSADIVFDAYGVVRAWS